MLILIFLNLNLIFISLYSKFNFEKNKLLIEKVRKGKVYTINRFPKEPTKKAETCQAFLGQFYSDDKDFIKLVNINFRRVFMIINYS